MGKLKQKDYRLKMIELDIHTWIALLLCEENETRFRLNVQTNDEQTSVHSEILILMTLSSERSSSKELAIGDKRRSPFNFEIEAIYECQEIISTELMEIELRNESENLYNQFSNLIRKILGVVNVDLIELPSYDQLAIESNNG